MASAHSIVAIVASVVVLFGSGVAARRTDCPNGQPARARETVLFRWTIHNFSMRADDEKGQSISSPLFPIDADSSTPKWLLRLEPDGNEDHVSLSLCLDSKQKDVQLATYHFRVLANDYSTTGNVHSVSGKNYVIDLGGPGPGLPWIMNSARECSSVRVTPIKFPNKNGHCKKHSKFLAKSSLSKYLWDDGTIHITSEIQVSDKSEYAGAPDGLYDQKVSNIQTFTDWCDTYRTVEALSSTWDIQNFTQKWSENNTIFSATIKGSEVPVVEWETGLGMRMVVHTSGESDRYSGLWVCLKSFEQDSEVLTKIRITVWANDTANNSVFRNPDWMGRYSLEEHNPSIISSCWGWERALSYSEIEGLLRDDSLTVTTEVTRIKEVSPCCKDLPSLTQTCLAPPKDENPDTLIVNNISNLVPTEFLNPTGGDPFPPNVLFLYATLKNNLNEDEEMDDDKKASINAMGAYAFRGDTNPNSVGIVSDLLVLAHKNQLEDLKKDCEEILLDKITVEDTIRILLAADETNSMELKEKAFEFLLANRDQVFATKDFANLRDTDRPSLLIQILRRTLEGNQP